VRRSLTSAVVLLFTNPAVPAPTITVIVNDLAGTPPGVGHACRAADDSNLPADRDRYGLAEAGSRFRRSVRASAVPRPDPPV